MELTQQIEQLLLDPTEKTAEPAAGSVGQFRAFAVSKSIDEQARTIRFICSTRNVDRYGEIVEPSAFSDWLQTFESNPVFVAGHTYIAPDGSPTVIGYWSDLQVTENGLEATAHFLDGDDLAEKYWTRYKAGAMRAVSIGFIARAWEMKDFDFPDGETRRVRVFTEVELLEISAVAIPANRQSLMRRLGLAAGIGGDSNPDQSIPEPLLKAIRDAVRDELVSLAVDDDSPLRSLLVSDGERGQRDLDGESFDYFADTNGPDQNSADELPNDSGELKNELRDLLNVASGTN